MTTITLSEYRSTDTNMILADVQMLANSHMFANGLLDEGWFFNFDRARKRFGLCSHTKKEICMSKYFTPLRTFEENLNTILHEIAHALVGPGHGHDEVWRAKAIELGSDGERCGKVSSGESLDARWYGVCPNCNESTSGFHRAPGRVRSCSNGHASTVLEWFEFGEHKHWSQMPKKYVDEFLALTDKFGSDVLFGRVEVDNGWMDENDLCNAYGDDQLY